VETVLIQSAADLLEKLKKIIADEGIKKLGLEKEDLKLGEYLVFKEKLAGIDLEPLPIVVAQIRQIKDEEEVKAIKKACEATDACLHWLIKNIKKGQREKEIAWMIEKWIKEKGMDFSFYPIVAIDENSAVAHYDTKRDGEKKVFDNCTILVDMGVKVDDYCSDITRVFFFGKPKNEQIVIYQKLLQAQKKTIEAIKPAILASQIDQFCRSLLEPLAFYPHSTGHGIGLEVHEFPKISSQSKTTIEPGMVFTIEPGVYLKDQFGIRIEDAVLVEVDGAKTLTNFSKEIIVI
jgi:Xaa-Pro aminopeptidase